MKKFNCSNAAVFILTAVLAVGFSSCVNEEYDPENINTEVTIAGEGLSLPLGSTKQLVLKDLLTGLDGDMLQVLDGGAYALRINDTLSLGDQMPDMTDIMNIPDVEFGKTMTYSLSGINAESMSIDAQTFEYEFGLTDEGIVPEVELPEIFIEHVDDMGVWEYGKAAREMEIEMDDVHVETDPLFDLPSGIDKNASEDIALGEAVEATVDPSAVVLSVKSECPEGISNISDIKMTETSVVNVTLSVVNPFISKGEIIPDLVLDLAGIVLLEGDKKNIDIDEDFKLDADNGYTITKSFRIKEIVVDEEDWSSDNKLSMEENLEVSGTAVLKDAYVDAGKLSSYTGGMGLKVDVQFEDLLIESVMMDVDEKEVVEKMDIPVTLNDMTLPEGVKSVDRVVFAENSCLDLIIKLSNISDIKGLETKLATLEMTFPEEMKVREAVDGKVTFTDVDLSEGMDKKIHIDEISLPAPVDGKISYEAHVMVEAHMTAGGRICSADVPYTEDKDGAFVVDAESHFEMEDYVVQLEGLSHTLEVEAYDVNYDMPDNISDIGTFTVIPEGSPVLKVNMNLPQTEVAVNAGKNGLKLSFPEFLRFKDVEDEYSFDKESNSITLKGEIPEVISMPIDRLVVTPKVNPETGRYVAGGQILIEGSIALPDGEIWGSDLDELVGVEASVNAEIPELKAAELIFDHFEVSVSEAVEFEILKAGDLPKEVKKVSLVELLDVDVDIDLKIDNLPDFGIDPGLDLVITMPEQLVLDANDERVNGNKVTVSGEIKKGKMDIAPIRINAIDLSGFDVDSKEGLVGNISIEGAISAENPELDLESLDGDMLISLEAGIRDIKIGKIMANVAYDIEDVNQSFKLSGLPDFMKGEDFVLDLANPHLILKAKTNMGIPVSGTLSIIPIADGKEIAENAINANINLPYTETAAQTDSIMFWLGADQSLCPKDLYTFVEADINKLISRIPDELNLSLTAGTSSEIDCVVEPSAEYILDVEYDFVVPLEFGDDLNIAVKDTISGLPDILNELLAKNSVQLGGTVTSSLPLSLELEIELLDADGKVVPQENKAVQKISSCDAEGKPTESPLALTLDLKDGVSAKGIESLALSFKVTAPNCTGIPVDDKDYVQADIKVALPEGITIDIANMNSDEN